MKNLPILEVSLADSVPEDHIAYEAFRQNASFKIGNTRHGRSGTILDLTAWITTENIGIAIGLASLYVGYLALPNAEKPNQSASIADRAHFAFEHIKNKTIEGLVFTLVKAGINTLVFRDNSIGAHTVINFTTKRQLEYRLFLMDLGLANIRKNRSRYPEKCAFWLKFEKDDQLHLNAMGGENFEENKILDLV